MFNTCLGEIRRAVFSRGHVRLGESRRRQLREIFGESVDTDMYMSRGKIAIDNEMVHGNPSCSRVALEWLSSFSRLDLYLASKWPQRVDEHFLTFEDLNISRRRIMAILSREGIFILPR